MIEVIVLNQEPFKFLYKKKRELTNNNSHPGEKNEFFH